MPTVKGKSEVQRSIASIPQQIEERVLRGAARAGANVIADEARDRVISTEVRGAIKVRTQKSESAMKGLVQVKGKGAYIGPWLEYGTDPHFISVDDSQRNGLSVRKINEKAKDGSLVINGQFVGGTVYHPGARPHPFLRPALDTKENEAIAAARGYIAARVKPSGIVGSDEGDAA